MMSEAVVQEENLRFGFGKNWQAFLSNLNEERIQVAAQSLLTSLKCQTLEGKRFLDIGSGSGLFSLAARRLGAEVFSFDYDAHSVACTQFLRDKYYPADKLWHVEQGSVLDSEYLKELGQFDIVYSWGVLHHTGNMKAAFKNVVPLVKPKGLLFISIYNDQGGASRRWLWIKKTYNNSGFIVKRLLEFYTLIRQWSLSVLKDTITTGNPFKSWKGYAINRGMSPYYDLIDWVGGYPFEVAKPEEVFNFFSVHGFRLMNLKTCGGGLGCNEFVFSKEV